MLIIFDLDDTLIDTSGTITPYLLRKSLSFLQDRGLECADFETAYQRLTELNQKVGNSNQALATFLEEWGAPKSYYDLAIREVCEKPTYLSYVKPVSHALETVDELAQSHHLALVTRGKKGVQEEKIRCAGLPIKLFSYVCFCEKKEGAYQRKKNVYASIAKKIDISPESVLVCGDRISLDLTPAKELGYITVQMRWGRALGNTGFKRDVDYTILDLREISSIAQSIKMTV